MAKSELDEILERYDPDPLPGASKKSRRAYSLARKANIARWRICIRQPKFLTALRQLAFDFAATSDFSTRVMEVTQFSNEWDIPQLPHSLLLTLSSTDEARWIHSIERYFMLCEVMR